MGRPYSQSRRRAQPESIDQRSGPHDAATPSGDCQTPRHTNDSNKRCQCSQALRRFNTFGRSVSRNAGTLPSDSAQPLLLQLRYCGRSAWQVHRELGATLRFELDHRKAKSILGKNRNDFDWRNIVVACRSCNVVKGQMKRAQFQKELRSLSAAVVRRLAVIRRQLLRGTGLAGTFFSGAGSAVLFHGPDQHLHHINAAVNPSGTRLRAAGAAGAGAGLDSAGLRRRRLAGRERDVGSRTSVLRSSFTGGPP
jgi:hypothetical protein